MDQPRVYVTWTINDSKGRAVKAVLELVQQHLDSGRTIWELEREVVYWPDGHSTKAPTETNPYPTAAVRPDPDEAIKSGAMVPIAREEFERCWEAPMTEAPGIGQRIRSWLGR